MADEPLVIHSIDWHQTLSFTQIFRSFRVAIHPAKLFLGLMALLCLYAGGRVLDVFGRAVPNELVAYTKFAHEGRADFHAIRQHEREQIEDQYVSLLRHYNVAPDSAAARDLASHGERLRELEDAILLNLHETCDAASYRLDNDKRAATALHNPADRQPARFRAHREFDEAVASAYASAEGELQSARLIRNTGIFAQLFDHQVNRVNGVARGVIHDNWLGPDGVAACVKDFFTVGPIWLMSQHPVYFVLYTVWFLTIWAIFGGAIARLAAVHVARDEKISVRAALQFSCGKFFAFFSAPVIPLIIVLLVGLLPLLSGLLCSIPGLGSLMLVVMSLLFFVILTAGFVMALVLLGTAGGFNLMYPTIAVEGSDSFDAISRSFSYVYARPWRMLLYTVVAVIYGALTFLFVQFFLYLMLSLAHLFVGCGLFSSAADTHPLWTTIWPGPESTGRLSYSLHWLPLRLDQRFDAVLIAFWVYLCVSLLGAFAISFYFSANTIVYYLMRHEVDATELDDVYLDQTEDEFHEPPLSPPSSPSLPGLAASAASEPSPAPTSPAPSTPPAPG